MDLGRKITDLEKMENVPEGTSYLAEAGDGSGTKQIEHKKLVETISKDINLGNLKDLDTNSKESVVEAINEVNEKVDTVFKGTDGIKSGTAGAVPAPQPAEDGYVLGANGKWVPAGEGGSLASKIIDDREELEANTEKGMLVDALVVKDINDNLCGFTPIIDEETGQITGYKTKAGADTVFPFSSGGGAFSVTLSGSAKATRSTADYNNTAGGTYKFDVSNLKTLILSNTTMTLKLDDVNVSYDKDTPIDISSNKVCELSYSQKVSGSASISFSTVATFS